MPHRYQTSPSFAVTRTAHLLRATTAEALKAAGWPYSTEETLALIVLDQTPRAVAMNELAELMVRDATTIKRQLDPLVAAGLVERRQAITDRRLVEVLLTPQGREALRTVEPLLAELHAEVMLGISEEACDQLVSTLLTIQANLRTYRDGGVAIGARSAVADCGE